MIVGSFHYFKGRIRSFDFSIRHMQTLDFAEFIQYTCPKDEDHHGAGKNQPVLAHVLSTHNVQFRISTFVMKRSMKYHYKNKNQAITNLIIFAVLLSHIILFVRFLVAEVLVSIYLFHIIDYGLKLLFLFEA